MPDISCEIADSVASGRFARLNNASRDMLQCSGFHNIVFCAVQQLAARECPCF
jgi:hypothetical protein